MTREEIEAGAGRITGRHTLVWWTPEGYETSERSDLPPVHPEAELVGYFSADGDGPHWL